LRTTSLVELVLHEFRDRHPHHAYSVAYRRLAKTTLRSISANVFIASLPWIVTVAFFVLAYLAWRTP
jgi:hypothetical protein